MEAIRDEIYKQIDSLYQSAIGVETAWMRKIAEREINRKFIDKENKESTNYELRVEFNGCSFRARWLRIQFVKRGNKTIRIPKSVAVPESGKYKLSQFKYAQDWELEFISQIEDVLSIFRV